MKTRRPTARDRIVRQAMRLFAERGYERTTIPEIQAAAGLAPGSGALYKHFASKEDVLRAGIEPFLSEAQQARSRLDDTNSPLSEALGFIARQTLEILAEGQDELRIFWRDLEQFPKLQSKVRRDVMQKSYRSLADWLRDRVEKKDVREHDSDAVSAVLLGSLTMFRVFEALWGEKTIPVDDDRFLKAWCDVALHGLTIAGLPSTPRPVSPAKSRRR
jgi:AcrR family transcriptional regulator